MLVLLSCSLRFLRCRYFNSGGAPLECDKEFWDLRDSVVQCEILILRQLSFQVSFEHPHKVNLWAPEHEHDTKNLNSVATQMQNYTLQQTVWLPHFCLLPVTVLLIYIFKKTALGCLACVLCINQVSLFSSVFAALHVVCQVTGEPPCLVSNPCHWDVLGLA